MTNPQRIGTDLAEQKVLADIAEYGWRLLRLAGLFVQRADLRCIPGLTSALAACAERNTSAPGDGESEA